MAEHLPPHSLDRALERWFQANILTEPQVARIREFEAASAPEPVGAPATITPTTILIYIGVFLVLVASVVFVALGWSDMGKTEQLVWGTLAVAVPWTGGTFLRRSRQPLAEHGSNILMAIGSIALILFAYTLANLAGWWPERSMRQVDRDRQSDIMLAGQTLTVIVSAFFAFRFRAAWMLAISGIVGWVVWVQFVDRFWHGDTPDITDQWKFALYGMTLVILGLVVDRLALKRHAFVLIFIGLAASFTFLGIDAYDDALGLTGVMFLGMAIVAIVLSMVTAYRVFLIFGALGLYGWLSALVVETFGGSRPVAFGLILLGAVIVVAGTLWQYRLGGWVQRRRDHGDRSRPHAA